MSYGYQALFQKLIKRMRRVDESWERQTAPWRAASDTVAPSQLLAAVMRSYPTPLGGAAHQPHTTAQCAAAAAWLLAAAGGRGSRGNCSDHWISGETLGISY
eukprot:COSAG01_NODE_2953_length_6803_cov_3.014471_4_plen_102_part_00